MSTLLCKESVVSVQCSGSKGVRSFIVRVSIPAVFSRIWGILTRAADAANRQTRKYGKLNTINQAEYDVIRVSFMRLLYLGISFYVAITLRGSTKYIYIY